MVKKIQYFIVLTLLLVMVTSFTLDGRKAVGTLRTIVIDPGHGGKDPGCHGVTHNEKTIALAVALKLGKYIEEHMEDVKVIYTRTTDVFVELEDRAQIANKAKADLFISIHCNAAGKVVKITNPKTGKTHTKMYKNKKGKLVPVETINPVPFGTETYVMGLKNEAGKMRVATRENSAIFYEDDYQTKYGGFDPESEESYIIMSNYTSAYVIQSANLAMKIQEEYTRKAGRIDKGVHRQSIWVLWRTSMPSILTEIGYLTNPLEETFLSSDQGQDYLAKALFRGLRKYKDEYEGKKKEYNDEFENQVALENENIKAGNLPPQKKEEDEEDDLKEPEKKAETKDSVVVEPKKAPKKSDTGLVKVNVPRPNPSLEKDSAVNAKQIAEKFKNGRQLPPVIKHEIVFTVQVASSDAPLDVKQGKYAVLKDVDFYRLNNSLKYTSGHFNTFKEAASHQNFLRNNGFADCFVIAFKNGQRVDLNEAKKASGQ